MEEDPRIAEFKRLALEQAQQAPPVITPMAQMPSLQPPAPNIQAPAPPVVTPVQTQPGPIKSFLQQFVHGAGQGLLTNAGLENDSQRQQRLFNQGIATQGAARQGQLTDAQIGNFNSLASDRDAQAKLVELGDYGIPGLSGQVPQKNVAGLIAQHVKNLGSQAVANTRAGATTDAAQIRADASTQNAETSANVRRDIGSGNLRMVGARLALAQKVAAAKADGSFGTAPADRLRRGDLANNAQHNINSVIEEVQTDPNLFGKIAGHFTTTEQMIGSSDPTIAKIGVQIHNAALASNGAHGLRSATAVADTEKDLLNHFRNSPEATAAALAAQNQSLDTFIEDAANGKKFVPHNASAPAATHVFNPATGKIEAINGK